MRSTIRKTLTGAIAAVTAGSLALGGVAFAQTADDPATDDSTTDSPEARWHRHHRGPRGGGIPELAELTGLSVQDIADQLAAGSTVADIAAANGSSADAVVAAMVANLEEKLADAVADERITQEEADEKLTDAEARFTEVVNSENPRAARFADKLAQRQAQREALADVLGVTVDDLAQAREDGTTLDELAAQQGVAVDDVVDVLVAPLQERLAGAVADERITQEEADERLAEAEERITEAIESGEAPRLGRRGPGRGFGPGGFGPGNGAELQDTVNA